jgi:hypothetical protein
VAKDPGTETCNGVDDDCDGATDEGLGTTTCGEGACRVTVQNCVNGSPQTCIPDPPGLESCNGADDDCDGETDEGDATGCTAYYTDSDGDGFGTGAPICRCSRPVGTTPALGDCNDADPAVHPGAAEACNGRDDDCDGTTDTGGTCLAFSNVPQDLVWKASAVTVVSASGIIHTETGKIDGLRDAGTGVINGILFTPVTQTNGPTLGVFAFRALTVNAGVTLTVAGANPLVILGQESIAVQGTILVRGADSAKVLSTGGPNAGGTGVAGGASGGAGSNTYAQGATKGSGTGAGAIGIAGVHYGNGGGGAGFCWGGGGGMGDRPSIAGAAGTKTAGGAGGYNGGDGGRGGNGGAPYGAGSLVPLLGGSGGGGGYSDTDCNPCGGGSGGGAGGGAIQISCHGTVTIAGTLDCSGGSAGDAWGGGGGGGSGGAILVEAPVVATVSGSHLVAPGGRGGNGNLNWVPGGKTGGTAGGASNLGGGGGQNESGGGGGGAGRIFVRYRQTFTVGGEVVPALGTDCGVSSKAE